MIQFQFTVKNKSTKGKGMRKEQFLNEDGVSIREYNVHVQYSTCMYCNWDGGYFSGVYVLYDRNGILKTKPLF